MVLLAGALFIIPESRKQHLAVFVNVFVDQLVARWLLYKGKDAKAERALNKIHGEATHSEMIVQEQLAILNKSREEEASSSSGESKWSDLWSKSPWTAGEQKAGLRPFRESCGATKAVCDRRHPGFATDLWCAMRVSLFFFCYST